MMRLPFLILLILTLLPFALAAGTLPGDCNEDWGVSIGEVQRSINMFLSTEPPDCRTDSNGDTQVSIGEVQRVINGFLGDIPIHTLTASAGDGGTLDPLGEIPCADGTSQTFSVIPEAGLSIDDLWIDGLSAGALDLYTFTEVREDHAIHAEFTLTCQAPTITGQPLGQTVPWNQTATISVEATGTEPLRFQWYAGESGDTANPIAGAIEPSYTTPSLTEDILLWVGITNSCGTAESETALIEISGAPNEKPVAHIEGPDVVDEEAEVLFGGGGSYDSDGILVDYSWSVTGDGEVVDKTNGDTVGVRAGEVPSTGGSFTVTLQVQDDDGAWSDPIDKAVTVNNVNKPPVAVIIPDILSANEGRTVHFSSASYDRDPDGSIEAYQWNIFGDCSISGADDESSVNIDTGEVDIGGGSCTVFLMVWDDLGALSPADIEYFTVTDGAPGCTEFSASADLIQDGEEVTLSWSQTNGVMAAINGTAVPLNGPWTDTPSSDAEYTLTITGVEGTTQATCGPVHVAVNHPPSANPDSGNCVRASSLILNVLDNDTDPDQDGLTVSAILSGPGHGTAEIIGGGLQIRYTNDGGGEDDSFEYGIGDGRGGTGSASAALTVVDNPVCGDFAPSAPLVQDGEPVTLSWIQSEGVSAVINGITVPLDGPWDDSPNLDTDYLLTVTGVAGTTPAVCGPAHVEVNHPPDAVDDSEMIPQGTEMDIPVLSNDSDPDPGDSLTVAEIVTPPSIGTASINPDGTIHFQSDGTIGLDHLVYRVVDGMGGEDTAQVELLVSNNDPFCSFEASSAIIQDGDQVTLSWTQVNGVSADINGTPVPLDGPWDDSPTMDSDYTLTITGTAGTTPAVCGPVHVEVNHPPDPSYDPNNTMDAGGTLDIDVLANDGDPDPEDVPNLVVSRILTQPTSGGSVQVIGGGVQGSPQVRVTSDGTPGLFLNIRYEVSDQRGGLATAWIAVNVVAVP